MPDDELQLVAQTRSPDGPTVDLGEMLGRGGMGEVFRAFEPVLRRDVALKTLRADRIASEAHLHRFLDEAQTTAQLQHPGVVGVHAYGELPDGRPYFTMDEVRGQELSGLIEQHHRMGTPSLRRLVDLFGRVCETMAYVHSRRVLHRDLKAENIMVGEHGEVLVLDWGLAKMVGAIEAPADLTTSLSTSRSLSGGELTRHGAVLGTPMYMAPEQVYGGELTPGVDVYALGGVLYEILAGKSPRAGHESLDLVLAVAAAGLEPPEPPGPDALRALTMRCLVPTPEDRPTSADLVEAVRSWLDGAEREREADEMHEAALVELVSLQSMREAEASLASGVQRMRVAMPRAAAVEEKAELWALEDELAAMRVEATLARSRVEQQLWGALTRSAEHTGCRDALAGLFRGDHERAERSRDSVATLQAELALKAQLPFVSTPVRSDLEAYLEGLGSLSLETDPPGIEVIAHRVVERGRRLVEERSHSLGATPLEGVSLPPGSWVLHLFAADYEPVRVPILMTRQGAWTAQAPGKSGVVSMPPRGSLRLHEVFVPAGPFLSGGDPDAPGAYPRQELWCPAFVMAKFAVRNKEYLVFLNDLVEQGRPDEALRYSPHDYEGEDVRKNPLWGPDADGRFDLGPDADGDLWDLDWPVLMIDRVSALAYAAWLAEREGLPWRLPSEWEWEKAARGVDGRFFPWGDLQETTWFCNMGAGNTPCRSEEYPVDTSPYGVRHLAGNISDSCLELHADPLPADGVVRIRAAREGKNYVGRGGNWGCVGSQSRAATRGFTSGKRGTYTDGIRLVRSV